MGQEERELVAADAERGIGAADRHGDELAHLGEELVADGVALRVVDPLELVDVDEHERELRAVATRALDHPCDGLLEGAVVAEAGQAVAQGRFAGALVQLAHPRAGRLELGGRPKDLAGHPDREADEQEQHRTEGAQRLQRECNQRDRRAHDDLPAGDAGQAQCGAPVGVVAGHRRNIQHLARDRARIEHVACLGDDHPRGVGEADDSTGHVARRRGGGEHGGDRNRGDDHSGGLHACLARLDDQDASILDIRNRARPGRDDGRRQGLDVDGHTRGSLRAATGEEGGADDHAIRAVDGKREPVLRLASICRGRVTGCRGGDRRVRQQLLGGGPHLGELALDLGGGNLGLIGQALVMGDPRLFRDQANERRDGGDRQDRDGDEGQPEAQLDEPQAVAAIQDRIS